MLKIDKGALDAVMAAASQDVTRYNLNGVHVVAEGDSLTVTATDGHRMHRVKLGQYEAAPVLEAAVMELEALKAAARSVKGKGAALFVDAAASNQNGSVELSAGEASFAVEKKDGEYPNVEQVLPKGAPKMSVRLNARYLRDLANAVMKACPKGRGDALVDVEIFDELSPVRFRSENSDGAELLAVVMPVRK